jgi:hypothetical protein
MLNLALIPAGLSGDHEARFSTGIKDASLSSGSAATVTEGKEAGNGVAARPTPVANAGFRCADLNSRFAVQGTAGSTAAEGSNLGGPRKVQRYPRGTDRKEQLKAQGTGIMCDEQQNKDPSGSFSGNSRGSETAPFLKKADMPADDLQSKRAAAAAAAYTASLRSRRNPGTVKPRSAAGNAREAASTARTTGDPVLKANPPAGSRPSGFQRTVPKGSTASPTKAAQFSRDQEMPASNKGQSRTSSDSRYATNARSNAAANGCGAFPSSSASARYESLESLRSSYGAAKAPGKRTEAGGISSFLDLNSPPPDSPEYFDASRDASFGSDERQLGQQRARSSDLSSTACGGGGLSGTESSQGQGFSLFSEQPFAAQSKVDRTALNQQKAGQQGKQSEGPVSRHRPFATMLRQKQAEGLAQGLDQLNLSQETNPLAAPGGVNVPQSKTGKTGEPDPILFSSQSSKGVASKGASLFQTAPEVLFGGTNSTPPFSPVLSPTAKAPQAKPRVGDANGPQGIGNPFAPFGTQSAKESPTQPPSLFQTPPEALFGNVAPGFGASLPSPLFAQSPTVGFEKAKAAPPQGIFSFVFSAGSSGDTPKSAGQSLSSEKKDPEVDSAQFSQSFAERLRLAGAKAGGGALAGISSLEGSRGFRFKGSVPDGEPEAASEIQKSGPFEQQQPAQAPLFRGESPQGAANPQNPPFVAFGSTGGSPGTPAKRKSEQKMAKKPSPSNRNAFAATRTLPRTPVSKPPVPASPKLAMSATGGSVAFSRDGDGSQKTWGGETASFDTGEVQSMRVESPQPMDISPGRESWEVGGERGSLQGFAGFEQEDGIAPGVQKVAVERGGKRSAETMEAKNEKAGGAGFRSGGNAGSGKQKGAANQKYTARGASKDAGVNGPQASASYDGDLEEGSSSYEESESDKRAAGGGAAWAGKWTPPKQPYVYDSSDSDSEGEQDVNPEAQDKDWVKGETEKLERLKKTALGVGEGVDEESDNLTAEKDGGKAAGGGAEEVELLGAEVEEMDLGSVAEQQQAGSSQSDAENAAESAPKGPQESTRAQPAEQVRKPVSGNFESADQQGVKQAPAMTPEDGKTVSKEAAPTAPFVFGATKPSQPQAPAAAFAFQAQSPHSPFAGSPGTAPPGSPSPAPPGGPFVFMSGPTSPRSSPRRASSLRKSVEKGDPLRCSLERRQSVDRKKAARKSAEGTETTSLGVSANTATQGSARDEAHDPAESADRSGDSSKFAPFPGWSLGGEDVRSGYLSASPNPTFPGTPNSTFFGSPNPTFPGSPYPSFPASPAASEPSQTTSAGPVQPPKPPSQVRKARRVGPSRAQASWEKEQAGLSGGIPFTNLAGNGIGSPEAMEEESVGDPSLSGPQGGGSRKTTFHNLYYPETLSQGYAEYLKTGRMPNESRGVASEKGDAPPSLVSRLLRCSALLVILSKFGSFVGSDTCPLTSKQPMQPKSLTPAHYAWLLAGQCIQSALFRLIEM